METASSYKKEKDCAFFLFCPASCLTEKFLDVAKLTKNLFISVAYNRNNHKQQTPSTDVFKQLRIRKLPYAVHYYYSASDIENFKSGEIFKELSKEKPLFSFFLSKKSDSGKDTVTEEEKKAVYEIIIKERYWLKVSLQISIWNRERLLLFNSLRDRRPRREPIPYICDFSRCGLNARFMRSHLNLAPRSQI